MHRAFTYKTKITYSYNNMGTKGAGRSQAKISDDDILNALNAKGKVKIYETDFNQFNTGKTHIDGHKERLFVCKVGKRMDWGSGQIAGGFYFSFCKKMGL